MIDIDELAQIIREVDGEHKLGAGALAEAIVERLQVSESAKRTGLEVVGALEKIGAISDDEANDRRCEIIARNLLAEYKSPDSVAYRALREGRNIPEGSCDHQAVEAIKVALKMDVAGITQ